ncbi:MAG: proline--tRNA ligase [Magnetococcales bacterium]|nr:proline--tRNA ligase [Magnetococcales bacterium]
MRFTKTLIPTLKENPVEAHVASHRLMLRAGMVRQLAAGIYTWLPMGLRVLRRVEAIVREEMDAAGAQEILMPAVQPAELWQESGRWDLYGRELLRMVDRHDRPTCFGPTHEEVVTDLVRREVKSYRQLPANFYQIQTKFRDEIRPRFGVMRGREFIMKDAYSFDVDDAGADESYRVMFETYTRIFERCGLRFRAVEADTGSIGGASSHEFHVLAESGEDTIISCDRCAYAANLEKARAGTSHLPEASEASAMERVETPNQRTIEDVAKFLGVAASSTVKSLVVARDGEPVLLLLRGDHVLHEVKAAAALGGQVTFPGPEQVAEMTGLPVGSMGPIGVEIPLVADEALRHGGNWVCGANEEGWHITGVNWGRDLPEPEFKDLRSVSAGEPCPHCTEGKLTEDRGIEVGHVFKLGTKYSEALGSKVLNENGREQVTVMGCYGIGVSRIVAAAIEQNHDEGGIIWPMALTPFHVDLMLLNPKDAQTQEVAEALEKELTGAGLEVLMDDRDERLGVKFKDADLLGIPFRVLVGGRSLKSGVVEIQARVGGDKLPYAPDKAGSYLIDKVRNGAVG